MSETLFVFSWGGPPGLPLSATRHDFPCLSRNRRTLQACLGAVSARGSALRRKGCCVEQAGFLEAEAMPRPPAAGSPEPAGAQPMVRHFRQTFLWPIYLLPIEADSQVQDHCAYLLHSEPGSP